MQKLRIYIFKALGNENMSLHNYFNWYHTFSVDIFFIEYISYLRRHVMYTYNTALFEIIIYTHFIFRFIFILSQSFVWENQFTRYFMSH